MAGILSLSSLEHAVAGSTGTALATLLLFPLERVKTLLQIDAGNSEGLLDVFRRVLRHEGAHGLYQGCTPMLQTVGSSNFLYFYLFQGLKEPLAIAFGREEGVVGSYETLVSSALAGSINMVITEPLWRACVVAQAGVEDACSAGQHKQIAQAGVFGTVAHMWKSQGPRAMWRGLGTSLWLVANPVIQFFAYDWLKVLRKTNIDVSLVDAFFIGAAAKAIATVLTFPLQVAQSRLRLASGPESVGMVQCLRAIIREHGLLGLYFGLVPKLLQTVTHAAFMFAFYEKIYWAIRRLSRSSARQIRHMKRL